MKKKLMSLAKVFISGVLAFAILTSFCMLYYNIPVHASTSDGVTDYSWEKNKFYSRATEGFAMGKTNNEGYVNAYDYQEGMNIDVLIMGSSHMEGYNVAIKDGTAAQLDALLEDDVVYNIGTAKHRFLNCAKNFEAALEKYKPTKYVVIETYLVSFDESELQKAVDGTTEELESHSGGIIGLLQKMPLLRLLYMQLSNWMDASGQAKDTEKADTPIENTYDDLYLTILNNLSQTAKESNVELVILYHPTVTIDPESNTATNKDAEAARRFATYCEESGVAFVDMSERFFEEYNENHILPYGFINTSVGQGHLNKHGHQMIAEELFKFMGGNG